MHGADSNVFMYPPYPVEQATTIHAKAAAQAEWLKELNAAAESCVNSVLYKP